MFGLAKLALLSLLTGAAIGLVIGCFRVALKYMNTVIFFSIYISLKHAELILFQISVWYCYSLSVKILPHGETFS
jgi:hypothetical protein